MMVVLVVAASPMIHSESVIPRELPSLTTPAYDYHGLLGLIYLLLFLLLRICPLPRGGAGWRHRRFAQFQGTPEFGVRTYWVHVSRMQTKRHSEVHFEKFVVAQAEAASAWFSMISGGLGFLTRLRLIPD